MPSPPLSPPSLATTLNANAKPFVPKFGMRSSENTKRSKNTEDATCEESGTKGALSSPQKLNANANEFVPKRKVSSSTQQQQQQQNTDENISSTESVVVNEGILVAPSKEDIFEVTSQGNESEVEHLLVDDRGSKVEDVIEPKGPMPLSSSWTVYGLAPSVGNDQGNAFQPIQIVNVHDVETMWGALNNIPPPSVICVGASYFYFKSDIEPRWEHPSNEVGGCWIIMVRHDDVRNKAAVLDRLWEDLILGLSGGEIDCGRKEVNGLVCKVRVKQFTFQLWTRNCSSDLVKPIGEALRKLMASRCPELKTTSSNNIEFYSHQQLEKCTKTTGAFQRIQPLFST